MLTNNKHRISVIILMVLGFAAALVDHNFTGIIWSLNAIGWMVYAFSLEDKIAGATERMPKNTSRKP